MGKTSELLSLLKTGNSDAARRLIIKLKKSGKKKALTKELNVPDDNGQTVIHFCAAQNFVEFLQDLAELGASIDLADNKGYTPLHLAAASGRTSAVTALISMGADPNISSRTGDTALHLACHGGHVTSVEALVTENANCTMLNVSGHTPIDLACQSGHAQVVSLLLRSGQFSAAYLQRSDMPHTALMLAAKQGHNECIGLLVKHGFDVNRKLPGGNGGTALHEAALSGKVDTVRYLLQCGVDVQKTNAQGHTALDIVNMYTDPRTATIMKQVLQDALAHLARSRIAHQHAGQQHAGQQHVGQQHAGQQHVGQQHAGQQHVGQQHAGQQHAGQQPQPSTSLRNTSTTMPQPGFSYFPSSGQMMGQQQHKVSEGGAQQHTRQHHHIPNQPQGNMYRQSNHSSHQSMGQPHQSRQPQQPMGQNVGHSVGQSASHRSMGQSAGHSHQSVGQSSGHSHQSVGYSQQYSSSGHPHQQGAHFHQNISQSRLPTGQNHSQIGQSSPPVGHRQNIAAGVQQHQHSVSRHEPPPPQNVQHIYPKPGSPEAARKTPGIGGDLAAIIAAKAANRKPIVTSPTRKHSMELDDERYSRSMTVSGEPAVQQARAAVQRRRSSMSDRSSASPERNDPPTLPRRIQAAGPPAFKPVPPPTDDKGKVEGKELEVESLHPRRVSSGEGIERQQSRKSQQHNPPPPSSADNELMAKLMRRQNKISELEQAASEQPSQPTEDSIAELETVQSKPPPPPQRKTPTLNTTQPTPTNQPPPLVQPSVPPDETTNKQKKILNPPAPKPKEIEQEMTPWQQELAARKARMADNEPEPELVANEVQVQEKAAVSPSHIPKPAPKPKRSKPPSTQEQPLPSVPTFQPPPPLKQQEPVVVVEESEHPVLPVATLVASNIDQLSRSTSLSSLTTGTGSPQLSHAEHMPIQEWLTSYKLSDYAPVLEGNGYETTELMVGISHEELQEMGVNKIGHRKKMLSALSNCPQREHFFQVKPESVTVWLSVLHMSQYEETMVEAGYDDIDFICDVTLDDLHDIGISKRGHVKRLLQGIGELTELVKSVPESAAIEPSSLVPGPAPWTDETIIPPPANWTSSSTQKVDFGKMKDRLEMKMGVNRTSGPEEDRVASSSPPSLPPPPIPRRSGEYGGTHLPPQMPPKKNPSTLKEFITGNDELDSGTGKSFSVEDITAALGESDNEEAITASDSGLDQLNAVLQGLKEETPVDEEPEPDQLLADIDDMLADLSTHLDFMIPGSTS